MKRVVFFGSQKLGVEALKELCKKSDVRLVFTFDPDQHEKWEASVEDFARKKGITVVKTKTLSNEHVDMVLKAKPDFIFVFGWRNYIPKRVFQAPKGGAIGMHFSLLPRNRGFAPLNWAVIKGEKKTGASLFYITEKIDAGLLPGQVSFAILPSDYISDVKEKAERAGMRLFKQKLPLILSGKIKPKKQDERKATYNAMRTPEDGLIRWGKPAQEIYNLVRGVSDPYPGAFCFAEGRKIVIKKCRVGPRLDYSGTPGQIINKVLKNGKGEVWILSGKGIIILDEVEIDGRKENAAVFFKSLKTRLEPAW
ncbi:MAG: formyltransferase family protein [Candidatus Norongarragalinales archaeon]